MPKMDGIEATRRITARYPEIIVVGLSVNTDFNTTTATLPEGAVALITNETVVD